MRPRRAGRAGVDPVDKNISIPELPDANTVFAKPGFNIIATANSRDQGGERSVGGAQAAIQLRSHPDCRRQEDRSRNRPQTFHRLLAKFNIPATIEPALLDLLATVFRELREGKTSEGIGVKAPAQPSPPPRRSARRSMPCCTAGTSGTGG